MKIKILHMDVYRDGGTTGVEAELDGVLVDYFIWGTNGMAIRTGKQIGVSRKPSGIKLQASPYVQCDVEEIEALMEGIYDSEHNHIKLSAYGALAIELRRLKSAII